MMKQHFNTQKSERVHKVVNTQAKFSGAINYNNINNTEILIPTVMVAAASEAACMSSSSGGGSG